MPSGIDWEKVQLRRQVRERLSALSREELVLSDSALTARFLALPQVEAAQTIFAFWGISGKETETAQLIAQLLQRGKRVGLPRMLPERRMEVRQYDPETSLVPASFGILEPGEDCPVMAPADIDLALVPAMCYDRQGYRLGFGGGYYDRWLAHFPGLRVGLCRGCVLQDRVPIQAHDARVDILLTETESLSPERGGKLRGMTPPQIPGV
ncbi:5-formyltetrahydrofolate cyclo-ligase [Pseudoflavonifractor sp. 60]|uniref:5-formyltetrahydrofolate cyclo-ligase n=1 Tax=Pseudoflavonifractor sp. 60 TaxID=2304576 RepID=UPI00136BFF90|nr:5-formyltetrahydrofolate cyclo-ligase [Pseudoflavonifractor sp. 60]